MLMTPLSLSLPSLSSPSISLPPLSSALPPRRHRTRRKNRLRPKIPTKPQPPQTLTLTQTHELLLIREVEDRPPSEAAQLVEAEREPLLESESVDPFLPPDDRWLPGSVLGIAVRFAALLAVQTVVAVWFFGRTVAAAKEEEEGDRVRVRVSEEASGGPEFEKAVLEIREMAREAREQEVREAEDKTEGVKGEVGRGITKLRKSLVKGGMGAGFVRETKELVSEVKEVKDETNIKLTKRLAKGILDKEDESSYSRNKKVGFVRSKSRNLSAPKGFNAPNKRNKDINVVEAGMGILFFIIVSFSLLH